MNIKSVLLAVALLTCNQAMGQYRIRIDHFFEKRFQGGTTFEIVLPFKARVKSCFVHRSESPPTPIYDLRLPKKLGKITVSISQTDTTAAYLMELLKGDDVDIENNPTKNIFTAKFIDRKDSSHYHVEIVKEIQIHSKVYCILLSIAGSKRVLDYYLPLLIDAWRTSHVDITRNTRRRR